MTSLLRRAHPFSVPAVGLALIVIVLVLPSAKAAAVLYLATCALAVCTGAHRGVLRALAVMLPIWVLLFLLQGVWGDAPRIAGPWGMTFSQAGLAWAFSQGSRLAVITTASLVFADGFNPHQFLQAAISRRWPFGAAFLVVATLDAADRLAVQARRLREAQRARGVRVSGSLIVRLRALPALVFPLLLASLTEADDRALALETRGMLLATRRFAVNPPADSPLDRAVRWSALVAVIAVVCWRAVS